MYYKWKHGIFINKFKKHFSFSGKKLSDFHIQNCRTKIKFNLHKNRGYLGYRANLQINYLIAGSKEKFRILLLALKLWAKSKFINQLSIFLSPKYFKSFFHKLNAYN